MGSLLVGVLTVKLRRFLGLFSCRTDITFRLVGELGAAGKLDREPMSVAGSRPFFELLARVAAEFRGVFIVAELKPLNHHIVMPILQIGPRSAGNLLAPYSPRPGTEGLGVLGNHRLRVGELHGPRLADVRVAENFVIDVFLSHVLFLECPVALINPAYAKTAVLHTS